MGVSYDQSSRWQKLGAVPDDEFEAALADRRSLLPRYVLGDPAAPGRNADLDQARIVDRIERRRLYRRLISGMRIRSTTRNARFFDHFYSLHNLAVDCRGLTLAKAWLGLWWRQNFADPATRRQPLLDHRRDPVNELRISLTRLGKCRLKNAPHALAGVSPRIRSNRWTSSSPASSASQPS
jgi:hypothetical protein